MFFFLQGIFASRVLTDLCHAETEPTKMKKVNGPVKYALLATIVTLQTVQLLVITTAHVLKVKLPNFGFHIIRKENVPRVYSWRVRKYLRFL